MNEMLAPASETITQPCSEAKDLSATAHYETRTSAVSCGTADDAGSDAALNTGGRGAHVISQGNNGTHGTHGTDGGWFIASDVARALGCHKKRVHRMAQRDGWESREQANRLEYRVPSSLAQLIVQSPESDGEAPARVVRFADLAHSDAARQTVLWRQEAVELLRNNLHLGKEVALQLVVDHYRTNRPLFHCSVSALRIWDGNYGRHGIDGLVEQKRGRVGRKAFALDLETEDVLRTAARAVDYGSVVKGFGAGRLNVARAYRQLVGDPTVGGVARQWLHGEHASKSYVVPSVRERIKAAVSPLATKLIQVGPKAAKLDGPFTECSYETLRAGTAFTADDMTANVYVWCEWPNEQGFLLIRPQILAMMDIGSMAWLNFRAVMRSRGQYSKDDVWGLIGDTLDTIGLPERMVLEGGTWQSDVIVGHKTGLDDQSRVGGLESIGIKVIHTRSPRGKIIEAAFNSLQSAADNCKGYCGRQEMKDRPEAVKQQLYECEHGQAHPRQYFMHVSEYSKHLAGVMKALNNERNDGKILRGSTPWDKWAEEKPEMRVMPDSSKWLYRAAYSVVTVTRNGARVTQGTGKFQVAYSYYHPALENRRGSRVVIYWNDSNPDTDALVYTIKGGKPDKLICVAQRNANPERFGATKEQMGAEGTRKKMAHNLAVSQSETLAPYLTRRVTSNQSSVTSDQSSVTSNQSVGERIDQVKAAAEAKLESARADERTRARAVREAEDITALGPVAERESSPYSISMEELKEL
jgi:hypothetical protein